MNLALIGSSFPVSGLNFFPLKMSGIMVNTDNVRLLISCCFKI